MPVAIFDMNETTLDLSRVRALVDEHLGDAGGFTVWFQKLLQLSMATTATGSEFHDFGTLARHAFDAVAASGGVTTGEGAFASVGAAITSIQAYPDVPEGLRRLRAGGLARLCLIVRQRVVATLGHQLSEGFDQRLANEPRIE